MSCTILDAQINGICFPLSEIVLFVCQKYLSKKIKKHVALGLLLLTKSIFDLLDSQNYQV